MSIVHRLLLGLLLVGTLVPGRAPAQDKPATAYLYGYPERGADRYFIAVRPDDGAPTAVVLSNIGGPARLRLDPVAGETSAQLAVRSALIAAAGDSALRAEIGQPDSPVWTAETWGRLWSHFDTGDGWSGSVGQLRVVRVNPLLTPERFSDERAAALGAFLYGRGKPAQAQVDSLPGVATDGAFYGKQRPALLASLRRALESETLQDGLRNLMLVSALEPTPAPGWRPPLVRGPVSRTGKLLWVALALALLAVVVVIILLVRARRMPVTGLDKAEMAVHSAEMAARSAEDRPAPAEPVAERRSRSGHFAEFDPSKMAGMADFSSPPEPGFPMPPPAGASSSTAPPAAPPAAPPTASRESEARIEQMAAELARVQQQVAEHEQQRQADAEAQSALPDAFAQFVQDARQTDVAQRESLRAELNGLTAQIDSYAQTAYAERNDRRRAEPVDRRDRSVATALLLAALRERPDLTDQLEEHALGLIEARAKVEPEALHPLLQRVEAALAQVKSIEQDGETTAALNRLRSDLVETHAELAAGRIRLRPAIDLAADAEDADVFEALADALVQARRAAADPVGTFGLELERIGRDRVAPLLRRHDDTGAGAMQRGDAWTALAVSCRLELIAPTPGEPVDPAVADIIAFEPGASGAAMQVVKLRSRGLRWGADATLGAPGEVVLRARVVASAL